MKEYAHEGIGALLLSLLTVLLKQYATEAAFPLAYGAATATLLLVLPSALGFNPALALVDFLIREHKGPPAFLLYRIGVQLVGALAGGVLASFAVRCVGDVPEMLNDSDLFCLSFLEGLGAMVIAFAYLHSSASGLAMVRAAATSLAIVAASTAMGERAPAVFNPAMHFALALAGNLTWSTFWSASVGVFLGSAAGASLFLLPRQLRD